MACCAFKQACLLLVYIITFVFSLGNNISHALVDFPDEDCNGVIPLNRLHNVDQSSLKEGQLVKVTWTDGKNYEGQILLLGKHVNTVALC